MPLRLVIQRAPALLSLLLLGGAGSGCIGNRIVHPVMPSLDELAEFNAAGPKIETYETDTLVSASRTGPYKLVPGDLVQFTLPPQVFPDYESESGAESKDVKMRVDEKGEVRLPILGAFPVGGLTLSEIEKAIATAYNAEDIFKKEPPNIVCTIEDYREVPVTVTGAVNSPGIHSLRSDRLSLLGALMAAGGIHTDRGASTIRIQRPGKEGEEEPPPVSVSVRNTDIPLQDIPLEGGETIVVEQRRDRYFAVLGLTKKAGIFPYPDDRYYNLMEALASAGGVDATAAPRFATVYRKKKSGEIIGATFRIDGLELLNGSNVLIKDGDVISIEHTEGSWFRSFLSDVFGFRLSGSTTTTL